MAQVNAQERVLLKYTITNRYVEKDSKDTHAILWPLRINLQDKSGEIFNEIGK